MEVKTVVIVNDFNYTQGGASKVAIDTARIVRNEGIEVYFFSAVNNEKENIEGVKYISTNQNEALEEKNKIKGAINGIYNFKAKKKLKQLLKTLDRETTIIHVHGWTKALSSSVFDIAFKMKFKVVLTLHDYFTACPNGGYFNYKENKICNMNPLSYKCIKCNCDSRNYAFKVYRLIRQFVQNKVVGLNKKIEYAISISNFSEKILRKTLNKNTNISRIYNPIELNKEESIVEPLKNKYYLYVGRISKEKGVDIFCKAMQDLGYDGIVVGDGSEKEKLEKEYNNITFTGWKEKSEVNEYMKNAKALIFPSKWYEGAPLTIIEAMSMGLPCIVSNNCAGKEFIENEVSGMIFDGDVESLKNKIMQYEKMNINNIGKCAYESYIKIPFNKESYFKNLMSCYNEILREVK